jgi:hypothetical protein
MNEEKRTSWVVYLMSAKNHPEGMRAVCEQSEWDAMQQDRSCQRTLIRAGITNEGEAERLARGTSGDPVRRGVGYLPPAGAVPSA